LANGSAQPLRNPREGRARKGAIRGAADVGDPHCPAATASGAGNGVSGLLVAAKRGAWPLVTWPGA